MVSGKSKQDYMIQSCLEHKIEIVANRKMLMNIQDRMNTIEAELKCVTSAEALDMEKLVGLKAVVDLFQAVIEQGNDRIVCEKHGTVILGKIEL